jgi:transcriptional regulator with XRE-family HTH domain
LHLSQMIGERLQLERKRLGMTQEQFAAQLDVSKRTQAAYEAGGSEPGVQYLLKAGELGLDIGFVLTGQPTPGAVETLSATEQRLIEQLRSLNTDDQGAVLRVAEVMAAASHK